jgi:ParB family chromosome partitioning protein
MKEGRIGEGHAKYLLGIENPGKQMMLFRKILNNNLNVSDTSKEARRLGGTRQAKIKINYKDKDKEFAFREFFGTKVEIKRGRKGGQVIIDFFSDDELEGFVSKLKV